MFGDLYLDIGNYNKLVGLNCLWFVLYGKIYFGIFVGWFLDGCVFIDVFGMWFLFELFWIDNIFCIIGVVVLVVNILVIFVVNVLLMLFFIVYELRNSDLNVFKYGMNFVVGGLGVFNFYGMLNLCG